MIAINFPQNWNFKSVHLESKSDPSDLITSGQFYACLDHLYISIWMWDPITSMEETSTQKKCMSSCKTSAE